jgi:hypothetical protein
MVRSRPAAAPDLPAGALFSDDSRPGAERLFGFLPLPVHVDRDEDDRVDRVKRPVLPLGHALNDLVGDRGDRLPRHLRASS